MSFCINSYSALTSFIIRKVPARFPPRFRHQHRASRRWPGGPLLYTLFSTSLCDQNDTTMEYPFKLATKIHLVFPSWFLLSHNIMYWLQLFFHSPSQRLHGITVVDPSKLNLNYKGKSITTGNHSLPWKCIHAAHNSPLYSACGLILLLNSARTSIDQEPLTFAAAYKILGPTFPGSLDQKEKIYWLRRFNRLSPLKL